MMKSLGVLAVVAVVAVAATPCFLAPEHPDFSLALSATSTSTLPRIRFTAPRTLVRGVLLRQWSGRPDRKAFKVCKGFKDLQVRLVQLVRLVLQEPRAQPAFKDLLVRQVQLARQVLRGRTELLDHKGQQV
jgi:hypothetical protein